MNKVKFNPFSEILVEDFLRQSGYIGDAFKSFIADFLCQNTAVLGLDVTAQAVANMTVYVKPGRLYQAGSQGQLDVNLNPALNITAAHPTYPRIDRICVQYHEVADIPETRNVMVDTVTRQVTQKTVMTRIAGSVDFLVVTGVAAPGPAAPTVPDGWTSLAQINVRANTTSVLQTDITDERPTLKSLITHTHSGGVDGAPIGSNGLVDNSVTDVKIGNRTITDTVTASAEAGTLTNLLSKLGNVIKSITGKANWYTAPATTLQALSDLIVSTPGANKLLKLDANGKLPADITGDADTVDGKHASDFIPAGFCIQKTNIDINTLKTLGFYYCINCTNTPGGDGYLTVRPLDNNTVCQDYCLYTGTKFSKVCNSGVWSAWTQIATTDIAFIDRGLVPKNWNDAKLTGAYMVHTTWTPGQINSAVKALGLYPYGQLVIFNTTNDNSIQKIYFSHKGEVAIKQNYGGDENKTWKQLATTDQCGVSIGTIIPFLATKAQPGWLAVDTGALVSRTTYPDLWTWVQANAPLITEAAWQAQAAVQSSVGYYSSGDGSTTFRLPRIVDFVRGSDGTRLPGNWQGDALQNIVGSTKIVQITDYSTGSGAISMTNTSNTSISIGGGNGERKDLTFDASRVARTADETRPKSISMLYCVKAFDAPTNQGLIDITALANSVAGKVNLTDYASWGNDTNGGRKLPDGRIEQWGEFDYTGLARDTNKTISFPVPFVAAVSTVLLMRNTATILPINGVDNFSALNYSLSGFDFQFESTGAGNAVFGSTMRYRAWGR